MKRKHWSLRLLRAVPLLMMLSCILFIGVRARGMTVEELQAVIPHSYLAAALVLLMLYALKALSVLFPIVVLQVCAGLVFPLPLALGVNLAGAALEATLPYWIGRFTGAQSVTALLQKYPKAQRVTQFYQGRELFFSFFIRAISCLPLDAVSLLLGAMGLSYRKYLAGSVAGMLPGMVAATVLGRTATRPGSPLFWCALAFLAGVALASALLYRRALKKQT